MTIQSEIVSFLRKNKGRGYCDGCIKEKIPLRRSQQSQCTTAALAETAEFSRGDGQCANCGNNKLVIHAR